MSLWRKRHILKHGMYTELRWLVYTALDVQTGLSVTNKRLQYRVNQLSPWIDVPEIVENKEWSK